MDRAVPLIRIRQYTFGESDMLASNPDLTNLFTRGGGPTSPPVTSDFGGAHTAVSSTQPAKPSWAGRFAFPQKACEPHVCGGAAANVVWANERVVVFGSRWNTADQEGPPMHRKLQRSASSKPVSRSLVCLNENASCHNLIRSRFASCNHGGIDIEFTGTIVAILHLENEVNGKIRTKAREVFRIF